VHAAKFKMLFKLLLLYADLIKYFAFFILSRIEVDDQISKPLNLANSAVLRAVEEEEQQAKSGKILLYVRLFLVFVPIICCQKKT